METKIVPLETVKQWRVPPFQRALRENAKVLALAEEIKKDGGLIPGVITLGQVRGDSAIYIVDGMHRIHGFTLAGVPECLADFRVCTFADMAEMAAEFVQLNSQLVRLRPDDILRGLEASVPVLARLRAACPMIGYDQIRRNGSSPIISMSLTLRAWAAAAADTPTTGGGVVGSAPHLAQVMTEEDAGELIQFLKTALEAWGRDAEYARLWSLLNLVLCMWTWRRLVRPPSDRTTLQRHIFLTPRQFSKCLMGLSADSHYLDWLQGRTLSDRDRRPAYDRMKKIWATRLKDDLPGTIRFPQPSWSKSS